MLEGTNKITLNVASMKGVLQQYLQVSFGGQEVKVTNVKIPASYGAVDGIEIEFEVPPGGGKP